MKRFLRLLWIVLWLCVAPQYALGAEQAEFRTIGSFSAIEVSPDGKTVVGIVNASLRRDGTAGKSKLYIWDVDCLLAGGDACQSEQSLPFLRSSFLYWVSGTDQFVIDSLKPLQIGAHAPYARQDLGTLTAASRPKMMAADAAGLSPLEGWRVLQSEQRYLSTDGHVALSLLERDGELRIVWPEGQMVVPRYLYDSGSIMPLRYEIVVSGNGPGFYFWSASQGSRGRLLKYDGRRSRRIALPEDLKGSLGIVFPPNAAIAAAAFTADGVRGVEHQGPLAASINEHVRSVRRTRSDLELKKVSVSNDLTTWALLFSSVDGAQELHVVEPAKGKMRALSWVTVAGTDWASQKTSSAFVAVPRGRDFLPARLYTAGVKQAPRKLVIRFHGGPQINAAEDDPDWIRRLGALGFDLLDVDYRGSAGYGEKHLLALKRPAATVLTEDLGAAISWAQGQRYAQVGFLGTSAGGLAGVSALSSSELKLDFAVLESPLIDWPPGAIVKDCRRVEGQTLDRLFGFRKLPDGKCAPYSTGLLKRTSFASTPVFLIAGKRDTRTPFEIADGWMTKARANGACIHLASSEIGGHTLASWPSQDQEATRTAFKHWITTLGDRSACRSPKRP